ncbi:MAG: HD domain-containing protein [Clostridiales bacterium]|nr:HD domain-containing protein [Clostridiales bacterium]
MKYIEDFKEDDHIIGHYFCKQKQNLKSRAGKTYLSLKLQDRTGMIDAKVWDLNNDIQNFDENDFIKIDGVVLTYQNEPQLKLSKIRRSREGEYDPAEYIPRTDKDVAAMYQQVEELIRSVEDPQIRLLLEEIMIKDEHVRDAFQSSSAGKIMHHSYMGGLIEHTLAVTQICDFLGRRYKFVNRDILIAAALLHDIGKVFELSPFPDNDYTDDGELLGHIVMGAEFISRAAAKIEGFPHQLESLLKHCILAHHGEYEFGSPKLPKTMEALILHFADNADAKLAAVEKAIDSDASQNDWLGFNKMLQRNLRKTQF